MWKSGNCIFAREGTSKSSFLGSVFHANSSFFDTCFRNLWLPPFIEGIIHIILNLWIHLASHLRPKFVIFCTCWRPRGSPGDHAGMGTQKIMKNPCFGTLFLRPIWNSFACFSNIFFFNVFWTSLMLDFFSQGHRKGSILKHLGHQMQHFFAKYGKVKTAFSLERGHQNQAFQGLRFTEISGLLMRSVETCTFCSSSEALFTLYSI